MPYAVDLAGLWLEMRTMQVTDLPVLARAARQAAQTLAEKIKLQTGDSAG